MELDWTTFVLEIVNFLILVWLLKRFLYQPVLGFIARRQAGIEQTLAEAHGIREEADSLKAQYENRLADWAQERQKTLEALHHEMEQERARRLAALKQDLAQEAEKALVVETRRRQEFSRQAEQDALTLAARFAARLLERAADPQTTTNLARLLADDLSSLAGEQRAALRQAVSSSNGPIHVASAHPLDEAHRRGLEAAFTSFLDGVPVEWDYGVDPALVGGLRLSLGPWVLGANLRDELQAFADLAHESTHS